MRCTIPRKFCKSLFFVSFPIYLFCSMGQVEAASNKRYLQQESVDTTIQRGFIVLNEAASVAGLGFHQKEAIEQAKRIAQDLKRIAKGDPNERYVLWKISELESQIYLEEKDLLLQQMQKGIASINQLVARYNAEVGKNRPDFSTMHKIHIQMGTLSAQKADELADSFNKRYRAISREVVYSLEKAIMNGDLDKSREELGYCLRNRSYLTIPDSKYRQLESRVDGLNHARELIPGIDQNVSLVKSFILKNKLSDARNCIDSARNDFSEIRTFIPEQESGAISSKIDKVSHQFEVREDSLVTVNMSVLKYKGVQEANNYLQSVLKPSGVSREKIAYVDQSILKINSPDNGKMNKEIDEVAIEDDDNQTMVFDDIMSNAKKKAQQKTDSIRAAEETELKKAQIEKRYQDSLIVVAKEKAAEELRIQQEKAAEIVTEIYTLLEKNKIKKALDQFNNRKDFLVKYVGQDAFSMLDMTLTQSETGSKDQENTDRAIAYVSPVNNVGNDIPDAADERTQKNRQRAQEEIMSIYSMLEQNNIEEAYSKFQKIRAPLKKYLDKEVFDQLETSVVQAYTYTKTGY